MLRVASAPRIASARSTPAATATTVGIARSSSQLIAIVRRSSRVTGSPVGVEEERVDVADRTGLEQPGPVLARNVAAAVKCRSLVHRADPDEGDLASASRVERPLDRPVGQQDAPRVVAADDRRRVQVVDP